MRGIVKYTALASLLLSGGVSAAGAAGCPGASDFVSGDGLRCRLTAVGDGMWRLRTARADGAFPETGAVQALARWMGERAPGSVLETVAEKKGATTELLSPDGTRAVISGDGMLSFVAPSGRTVIEGVSVSKRGGMLSVAGRLLGKESVYGLGQRLDRLDKRGQKLRLYSRDGYNDSSTTYMAIPLFSTTRGGGVFVNSYGWIEADFGSERNDVWRMDVRGDSADVYFVATGSLRDVPSRYMLLSGRPAVPEKWEFGPVVCRYAPDFHSFKGPVARTVKGYLTYGKGLKDTVDAYREMGSLPTSVVAEGRTCDIFSGTEAERSEKAGFFKTGVDYLASAGIKYMIYMAAGDIITRAPEGYRRDFEVCADVCDASGRVTGKSVRRIPTVWFGSDNPDVSTNRKGRAFLDITNPDAWKWYLDSVWQPLLDAGVRGAKIDFCEQMPDDATAYGDVMVRYRWHDPSVFDGADVHHAYPTFFTVKLCRDLSERLAARGEGRFMALVRGGGIGMQRAPFMWAGDQKRSFDKLDDHVLAMLNSGMSGVPFMTYDMSGYHYVDPVQTPVGVFRRETKTVDLSRTVPEKGEETVHRRYSRTMSVGEEQKVFLRGLGFTAFSHCMQTHGYVRQPFEFDAATQALYVKYAELHRSLAPEIAKAAERATRDGVPVVRPLVFDYPEDENTWNIGDEYMFCDRYLVAPVLADTEHRSVYLPAGRWREFETGQVHTVPAGGKRFDVRVPVGGVAVFVRECGTGGGKPRLAFQVYAVRDLCEKDFEGTLRAVKALGYEGVETGRFYGRSAGELKALLERVGLELVALQLYPDDLTEPKLRDTLRFAKDCGADRINVAWFKGSAENHRDWQLLVNVVNHAAEVAAKEGIAIGYHNHDQEFRAKFGGKHVWDWLWERFSPLVKQEFDAGWCAIAGVDPHAVLKRYPHRNPTVHVMPAISDAAGLKPGEAGVGSVRDRIDWRKLAAEYAADGTEWFVVKPVSFPGSVEDLKASIEFLMEKDAL